MKPNPWILGAAGALLLAGLAYFLTGLWQPGQLIHPDIAGGGGKPMLAEAKKQAESLRQKYGLIAKENSQLGGLKGMDDEHRVFVSATLVFLPQNQEEPVQPLDRKMKTSDGLEIGWKMKYEFPPDDPAVAAMDVDGDGFTNLEEFQAGTDPRRREDSPAKESKLKSRSGSPVAMEVTFPEKSGGFFTVRFKVGSRRDGFKGKPGEFKGKPGETFWVLAGADKVDVIQEEAKVAPLVAKAKESGLGYHVIPVKIISYKEKLEKIKDMKAGGIEVETDNSELVVERLDALSGPQHLLLSSAQRPASVSWDIGDIRLYSPASGATPIPVLRVGQKFSFEGKEFAVVGREDKKIQLRNLTEPGSKGFEVPPESETPPTSSP